MNTETILKTCINISQIKLVNYMSLYSSYIGGGTELKVCAMSGVRVLNINNRSFVNINVIGTEINNCQVIVGFTPSSTLTLSYESWKRTKTGCYHVKLIFVSTNRIINIITRNSGFHIVDSQIWHVWILIVILIILLCVFVHRALCRF